MELSLSKGENRSLIAELGSLETQHHNLRERQKDLFLTLEYRERENDILREHIHGLREQNYRLITDHKQLLGKHAELRDVLEVQHFTVLRLTEESDKLRRIVRDKDLKIFDLKSLIDKRNHQIKDLKRKCYALQEGFKEQLTQCVSVQHLEILQDELAANKRILARTNVHVTDLEAENARLRALLARGGSLPQETGMSNDRSQPSGKKAPTKVRSWEETHHNLLDEEENSDMEDIDADQEDSPEDDASEDLEVSKILNPSLQHKKTKPAAPRSRVNRQEPDEEVTVTKIHSLKLGEADDTTLQDEEGYTTEESEFDQEASGGTRGRNRGNDQRHLYPPRRNR
ncbi:MAG: hypothetical protein EBY22_11540, partial [Gammaproteobacteria bacterium]|nr:hypothetical protein [Gammaproteobacteria bacterium]